MIRATILIAFLLVALASAGPITQKITASVKDTTVDGLEGLNIKWTVPFKIQDYNIGFKYSLGDFKKVPDSLFAKHSFETPYDGVASVDAEYSLSNKNLDVTADWVCDKLGVAVKTSGSTKDKLKEIGVTTTQKINGNEIKFDAKYNHPAEKFELSSTANLDDLLVKVKFDSKSQDPVLSVSYDVDSKNTVTPSVSLRDGEVSYGWKRSLEGGSIDATFNPGKNVEVEWTDNGSNGVWKTKADIPVSNHAGTKVSFSREWTY